MDEPRPCSSTLSYPPKITSAPCHVAAAIHHKTATLACVAFRRVAATCPTRRAKPDTRQRDRETHALLPLPPATTGHMQKSRHCENAANIGDFRQKKNPQNFRSESQPPMLAERGGFEPPVDLRLHRLSKAALSTTRTPLRKA